MGVTDSIPAAMIRCDPLRVFGFTAALPQLTGSTCLLVEVHRERREGENHTADNTREVFSHFQPIPTPMSSSKPHTGVLWTELSGFMGRPDTRWTLVCWWTWKIKTQRDRDARTLTHFGSIVLEAKALGKYPYFYLALNALKIHKRVWILNFRGRWLIWQRNSKKSSFGLYACVYGDEEEMPIFLIRTFGNTWNDLWNNAYILPLPSETLKFVKLLEIWLFGNICKLFWELWIFSLFFKAAWATILLLILQEFAN